MLNSLGLKDETDEGQHRDNDAESQIEDGVSTHVLVSQPHEIIPVDAVAPIKSD